MSDATAVEQEAWLGRVASGEDEAPSGVLVLSDGALRDAFGEAMGDLDRAGFVREAALRLLVAKVARGEPMDRIAVAACVEVAGELARKAAGQCL